MGYENDKYVNMNVTSDAVGENSTEDIVNRYRPQVAILTPYLNWLQQSMKASVMQNYSSEQLSHTIAFPVYDSNLLSFVKAAQRTTLLDRNYVYVYSRNRLDGAKSELRFIENATVRDMDDLAGILSKYVLGGMTKGSMWSEGVANGVLYSVISKMQELINFWS